MEHCKNNSGFTIVELLVTASIFIVIFTVAIMSFKGGENINSLQAAADQVAVNIREAQTKTLTGSNQGEITAAAGFGLYFDPANNSQYILFRDDGDNNFNDQQDTITATVSLPEQLTINSLTPEPLSIVFAPPKPDIYINGSSSTEDVNIILYSSRLDQKQGSISLNSFTGRVTAEIQDR